MRLIETAGWSKPECNDIDRDGGIEGGREKRRHRQKRDKVRCTTVMLIWQTKSAVN